MSTYSSLMRSPIRTLVMVAAMATAASFALPQEVQAQHFGHGLGHRSSFGHGFGGSRFYSPAYRPNRGSVRISQEFREDAQVYLDGAHVGVVDDFDGIFRAFVWFRESTSSRSSSTGTRASGSRSSSAVVGPTRFVTGSTLATPSD